MQKFHGLLYSNFSLRLLKALMSKKFTYSKLRNCCFSHAENWKIAKQENKEMNRNCYVMSLKMNKYDVVNVHGYCAL